MPYVARHVMNSILERTFSENRTDMTPMKAQKILFYTHGWHLAITGEPAIDQNFEVWAYGPVVRTIYQSLKKYGGNCISSYIQEYDVSTGEEASFVVSRDCHAFYQSLDIAWEKYIDIDAINLSAMTHEPGSPWARSLELGDAVISNRFIQEYFVELAER